MNIVAIPAAMPVRIERLQTRSWQLLTTPNGTGCGSSPQSDLPTTTEVTATTRPTAAPAPSSVRTKRRELLTPGSALEGIGGAERLHLHGGGLLAERLAVVSGADDEPVMHRHRDLRA